MNESIDPAARRARHLACLESLHRGIAHDAKGPMNAIGLNLELLRASAARHQDQNALRWLEVVDKELRGLDDYLTLVLAQTAAPSDDVRTVDIAELVSDVGRLLEAEARHRGVTLEIADEPPAGQRLASLRVDRVRQALLWVAVDILAAQESGTAVDLRTVVDEDEGTVAARISAVGTLPDVDSLARRVIAIEKGAVDLVDSTPSGAPSVSIRFPTIS